ncbi:uncharacterized protein B0H18DRAFT_288311 [Fomitopsis serialis]|uniref:uncharacterized protein n=1 Tax=Fomitopsis serialis TaxID=139415 RepID=UPI0020089BB0|nr:uncharacterized protein B0H18DRAFT_288311 [Neoantrodia serialis]KAH9911902.1 hypothetical protein B0H18DRAFT_288311 [Neoantrodia serialis]
MTIPTASLSCLPSRRRQRNAQPCLPAERFIPRTRRRTFHTDISVPCLQTPSSCRSTSSPRPNCACPYLVSVVVFASSVVPRPISSFAFRDDTDLAERALGDLDTLRLFGRGFSGEWLAARAQSDPGTGHRDSCPWRKQRFPRSVHYRETRPRRRSPGGSIRPTCKVLPNPSRHRAPCALDDRRSSSLRASCQPRDGEAMHDITTRSRVWSVAFSMARGRCSRRGVRRTDGPGR